MVTAKKTVENDGYASVQLGYGDVKPHKVNKPMKGFFDKAGVAPKKTLKSSALQTQTLTASVISLKQTYSPPATRLT